MTEHLTDYEKFFIYRDGKKYLKKNNNTHNKEGLYQAMWTEFCEGNPDAHATQKWENVLNGRYGNGEITVENGTMTFKFDPDGFRKLNEFKRIVSGILTNGQAPGIYGGKRRRRSS